jgi:hypothetical protein
MKHICSIMTTHVVENLQNSIEASQRICGQLGEQTGSGFQYIRDLTKGTIRREGDIKNSYIQQSDYLLNLNSLAHNKGV